MKIEKFYLTLEEHLGLSQVRNLILHEEQFGDSDLGRWIDAVLFLEIWLLDRHFASVQNILDREAPVW